MNDTPEVVAEELSAELQTLEQPAEQEQIIEQPVETVAEVPAEQPKAKKQKKARKPRPVAVRILCGFVAFILCIAMFAISLTGVLILNVRTIVSREGITQIITQLISGQTVSGPVRPALAVGAGVYMDEYTTGGDLSGSFVDWIYGIIMQEFGEELILTKEQVQTFVEESTVKDFVADKVAGLVEDFYSGESKTVITGEEIKELIHENKEILEEQFNLEINQEALDIVDAALEESGVLKPMEEEGQGLLEYIQQSLAAGQKPDLPEDGESGIVGDGVTDGGIGGGTDNTVGEVNPMESVTMIMEIIRTATSYETVMVLAGAFVLLMLLLFLVTGFSFPATLADTGVVLLLVGLIFGAPAAICLNAPDLVHAILPQPIGGVVSLIFSTTAGLNFTVLGVGVGLIVLAIVLKIILSVVQKKRA